MRLFATLLMCLSTPVLAQSFSCSFGKEPACLEYGAKVCSSFGKCVDQNTSCFDTYQCNYEGFTCKSNVTACNDDYDALVRKFNDLLYDNNELVEKYNAQLTKYDGLVDKFNRLLSDHEELVDKHNSLVSDYEDLEVKARNLAIAFEEMKDCTAGASDLDEAQDCKGN